MILQLLHFKDVETNLDKTLYPLKKLKDFSIAISNEAESYTIQRKLQEFANGCEVTKALLEVVSHKEVIIMIVDEVELGE